MREVVVLKLLRFATLFLALAVVGGLDARTNGLAAQSLDQLRASGAVGERLELPIPVGGFGEVKRFGGGSFFLVKERDVMCIASGIDADSDMQAGGLFHDNLR